MKIQKKLLYLIKKHNICCVWGAQDAPSDSKSTVQLSSSSSISEKNTQRDDNYLFMTQRKTNKENKNVNKEYQTMVLPK